MDLASTVTETTETKVFPIGKYKGKPVELVIANRQYVEWITAQPWFREQHAPIYNILVQRTGWEKVERLKQYVKHAERDEFSENEELLRRMTHHIGLAPGTSIERFFATPASWSCPCCRRKKQYIAQPSKDGRLNLNLVRHHDHAQDFLMDYTWQRQSDWRTKMPDKVRYHYNSLFRMFRRFEPIIICQKCNMLDVQAARMVGSAPPSFSFSAEELKLMLGREANVYSDTVKPREDLVRLVYPLARVEHEYVISRGKAAIDNMTRFFEETSEEHNMYYTAEMAYRLPLQDSVGP